MNSISPNTYTMNTTNELIIVKGKPKTFQIDQFDYDEKKALYKIKFKNSSTIFHYRISDVIVLKNPTKYDIANSKVYISELEQKDIAEIHLFQHKDLAYWRITYANGLTREYPYNNICVKTSCLKDKKAKSVFEYLKCVAQINELGKDEDHGGILPSLYENIKFIDDSTVAAPYLNRQNITTKKYTSKDIIFPFGCNASQEKAVNAAFENKISVIQGPPGTGKTQTILNIIANILTQGKTALVVSNNNSATINVLDKLKKYGFGFIVAPLGKKENKEIFISNQPTIPEELASWGRSRSEVSQLRKKRDDLLSKLRKTFALQEEYSTLRQEKENVALELKHFELENKKPSNTHDISSKLKSKQIMKLWMRCVTYDKNVQSHKFYISRIMDKITWQEILFRRKYLMRLKSEKNNITEIITELQNLYLITRYQEIDKRLTELEAELKYEDANALASDLSSTSLYYLKNYLYEKYSKKARRVYSDVNELRLYTKEVCEQYPIILSTTFSATTSIPKYCFDYVIMDEASQISIETGFLAMTCAKNAIIVGDTMQLPNVITEEDKKKLDSVFNKYKIPQGYNCAKFSFLQSICNVIPNVKQTLLREHYRCHPTIINFCNQRFYGGKLLIMTNDNKEENVMMAIKTVPGHHARGHYNQREIDVVKNEVIPQLNNPKDIGIITPYNDQVKEFKRQISSVESATIHKYQGREKDTIIMSAVDDQITEFSDDPNLINVAISRAKNHFCLVLSGNEQERNGNLSELINYIEYQNLTVQESKISSIFDYLYSNYTNERLSYISKHKKVSQYDSENLMYSLLENIFSEHPEYNRFGILCHTPVRSIIHDWSLLNEDERKYISHYSTHLDFLIINHVTKKPVLAIEIDGYSYHSTDKVQHQRDIKKDHILALYELPLLRLKTNESNEEGKIVKALSSILNQ